MIDAQLKYELLNWKLLIFRVFVSTEQLQDKMSRRRSVWIYPATFTEQTQEPVSRRKVSDDLTQLLIWLIS